MHQTKSIYAFILYGSGVRTALFAVEARCRIEQELAYDQQDMALLACQYPGERTSFIRMPEPIGMAWDWKCLPDGQRGVVYGDTDLGWTISFRATPVSLWHSHTVRIMYLGSPIPADNRYSVSPLQSGASGRTLTRAASH